MRYRNLIYVIVFFFIPICQAAAIETDGLQDVPRIVYEIYPDIWYQNQAGLWQAETEKHPQDARAWYNYYNATRYGNFMHANRKERNRQLNAIIEKMGKAVPNSYEYALLKYRTNDNPDDLSGARRAYRINPDRPDTYYSFISYFISHGKQDSLRMFCKKLYRSGDIEPWLYIYNYNMLMSLDQDAILFTNGDNDTYPVWVLQQAKGIRPDVLVLNVSLLTVESYFNNTLKKRYPKMKFDYFKKAAADQPKEHLPAFVHSILTTLAKEVPQNKIFLALTMAGTHVKPIQDHLYLTGLAYCYAGERFDNLAHLVNNLENRFLLDNLVLDLNDNKRIGKNLSARMQRNYLPGMLLLIDHYRQSGNVYRATHWAKRAYALAKMTQFDKVAADIEKKYRALLD